jgi:hypothetical protein
MKTCPIIWNVVRCRAALLGLHLAGVPCGMEEESVGRNYIAVFTLAQISVSKRAKADNLLTKSADLRGD